MRYLIFALLFVSNIAVAADMQRFNTFTENIGTVSATFKQIKMLPESTKKFSSHGRVKFVKDVGFIWLQDAPASQVFVSTKEKYCVDGVAKDLKSLPYFYYVRGMIDNALNGNVADLEAVFKIDYSEYGKNNWQLTAKPRFDAVADVLQDVVMYGNTTDLTKVIITYYDGTIVIIQFNRMNTEIKDEIVC